MAQRASGDGEQEPLVEALAAVLRPLARLAVARGLPFGQAREAFERAFVEAALDAQPKGARQVSTIATATGMNRRVLPRQGSGASFESLARAVTTDVHPRSLLDELLRLGLATHDGASDTVALVRDAFVPRGDAARMLGFLADNVGDHLAGAVDNVLGDGSRHFEQAVFADALSAHSMQEVRRLVGAQWQLMTRALVPALEALIADDRDAGRAPDRRLRIGLYAYDAQVAEGRAAKRGRAAKDTKS
jgi:hypothetical protein